MNCKHLSLRLQNFDLIRKKEARNNSDYKYHQEARNINLAFQNSILCRWEKEHE